MKRPRKECLACILSLAALALLLAFFTVLLTPKQHDHGAGWGQFRQEAEQSIDVLVVGSSMAYCRSISGRPCGPSGPGPSCLRSPAPSGSPGPATKS